MKYYWYNRIRRLWCWIVGHDYQRDLGFPDNGNEIVCQRCRKWKQ